MEWYKEHHVVKPFSRRILSSIRDQRTKGQGTPKKLRNKGGH